MAQLGLGIVYGGRIIVRRLIGLPRRDVVLEYELAAPLVKPVSCPFPEQPVVIVGIPEGLQAVDA